MAKREVILSAGTVNTPQLLMLSGIGPRQHLKSMKIDVVADLPGVGENLHNHQSFGMDFSLDEEFYPMFNQTNVDQYLYNQTGPLSGTGLAQVTGVWYSNLTTPDDPDIQIFFAGYQAICTPRGKIADLSVKNNKHSVRISALNLQPTSKGKNSFSFLFCYKFTEILHLILSSNFTYYIYLYYRTLLAVLLFRSWHASFTCCSVYLYLSFVPTSVDFIQHDDRSQVESR